MAKIGLSRPKIDVTDKKLHFELQKIDFLKISDQNLFKLKIYKFSVLTHTILFVEKFTANAAHLK